MKKALVFCAKDWRTPGAGWVERYCFQVFSRLARQGYQIFWVCQDNFGRLLSESNKRGVETVDGIQVARLGLPMFHRPMTGMLLSRLANTHRLREQYDVIIDCVNGKPMRIPDNADIPVAPLVFNLSKGARISEDPPSPFVAASERARRRITGAGVSKENVVYAPYGVDPEMYTPGGGPQHDGFVITAIDDRPRVFLGALSHPSVQQFAPHAALIGRKKPWSAPPSVHYRPVLPKEERAALFQHSTVGFCGEGREHEALAMAACGLPVIAPATIEGEEYVEHNVNGLTYEPGDIASAREQLSAVIEDDALRERLAANAQEGIQSRSWDKTTELIRAVLERI